MSQVHWKKAVEMFVCAIAVAGVLTVSAVAQYPGGGGGGTSGGGTTGGGTTGGGTTGAGMTAGAAISGASAPNYHVGFDRPEAWALKYFTSTSLLSGLQPPEPSEGYRVGSVSVGLEMDWLPQLDAGQTQVGFNGKQPLDLNKAPIFARPVVRVGLPGKFSVVAAAPPPFEVFGVKSHLLALGLERPLWARNQWTVSWRGYGQVGSVKGAFTCPGNVLAFAPRSAGNPAGCVAESADKASLRYAGSEFQFAYKIPSRPKIVPHFAVGGNFIDGVFQVDAPLQNTVSHTRLWTRGGTFSPSAGVSYLVTKKASITVDAFYTPLWVKRSDLAPRTNDGLFNVRALLNYTIR